MTITIIGVAAFIASMYGLWEALKSVSEGSNFDEKWEEEVCTTCDGTGEVVENAGCCGGCEICGSREEKIIKCPDCK